MNMFPKKRLPVGIWVVLAVLVLALAYRGWNEIETPPPVTMMAVLVPDGMDASEPALAIWLDAAREEGLPVETIHISSLIGESVWGKKPRTPQAMILPDQVLRHGDRRLLAPLRSFVDNGGWLLVTYDAFTRQGQGRGEEGGGRALLSDLVGVDYALFDTLKTGATVVGPALGSEETMKLLQIPPGKAVPWQQDSGKLALTTYQYGFVNYPHFLTRGAYPGRVLLEAPDGSILLGERKVGRGGILFANLPLGSLKGRTDGILLHAALRHFSVNLQGFPSLLPSPGGVGGLVFNWHVDSNTSVPAFEELNRRGLLTQGPFSIHLTAGPDAYRPGDRAGMDLDHNQPMQQWIQRFKARGDELGNHGGWIHDYFGANVSGSNRLKMKTFLARNDAAVRAQAGHDVLEYSAPLGNQPEWVTDWVEERGVLAYYFTGNTGMAPTRSYREGKLRARRIWSFPILTLNQIASFEEAAEEGIPVDYLQQWLVSIAEFASDSSTVRTFYSHPPGWRFYYGAIEKWFARTGELAAEGRFRWYTMTRIAVFLNRREQVRWQAEKTGDGERLSASHPDSLAEMSWRLPKVRYNRPVIESGKAQISDTGDSWTVTASEGKSLAFKASTKENRP